MTALSPILRAARKPRLLKTHLPTLLLAGVAPLCSAHADTLGWLGGTSADWFTGANWSTGNVPTAADTAAINGSLVDMPQINAPGAVAGIVAIGGTTTGNTLGIVAGGTLATTTMNLGLGALTDGAVTVTGAGSDLTVAQDLNVGLYGGGSLSVLAGATASSGATNVGGFDGASGTVTVSGSGSSWTFTTANIGNYGTGKLVVSSGGTVEGTSANLGTLNSGVGSAEVTGTGSSWSLKGDLVVGYNGSGTLKVADGGHVDSPKTTIAFATGSQGGATVDGAGSKLSGAELVVGAYGTGTLDVTNGGTAASTSATLGAFVGGSGTASVAGTGSNLTTTTLTVGSFGTGALKVSDGGAASAANVVLGSAVGSTGTAHVSGSGSTLSASQGLVIGDYGTGALTIADGAKVSVGDGIAVVVAANPGATGTLNIGAAQGDAAAAAGTLAASQVAFGSGAGRLNFNVTDADYVFAPTITGAGSVAIQAGTVTLTGTNTYSGGTTIAGGTLIGTAASFGTGAVTADGAFVLRQDTDATFANVIDGTGTFAKEGTGLVTLTGTGGFTGATQVRAGTLAVNGSLAGSVVTVEQGARLSGTGTVGGLDVKDGAILSPGTGTGGGTGTLTVTGNVTQQAGSLYVVQAGGGASDRIVATGVVTIEPGAVLNVTNTSGSPYPVDAQYTVVTAFSGVAGNYILTGDTRVSAFYTLVAVNDGANIILDSTQTRAFTAAAATRNQRAAAAGLQSLPEGNSARDAVGAQQTDRAARAAFNLLSGEIYASAKSVLLDDSRFVRDASLGRVRAAFGGDGGSGAATRCIGGDGLQLRGAQTADCPTVWVQGFGSWGSYDGDGNAAGLTRTIGGILGGADATIAPGVRAGVIGGYSRSTFNVDARNSSGASDNYSVGAYGGTQWGALGLRAGTTFTYSDVAVDRTPAFPGLFQILSSGYGAATSQVFGEVGYRMGTPAGFSVEPFAGLAYVNLWTGDMVETGGSAALVSGSSSDAVTYSTLGLRLASAFTVVGQEVKVGGTAGWRHAFGDMTPTATLAFVGGGPFTVAGVPMAQDVGVLEAEISTALSRFSFFTLSYSGQFGDGVQDQAVRGNFAAHF